MATKAGRIWRAHGALQYREFASTPKRMIYGGFKALVDLQRGVPAS